MKIFNEFWRRRKITFFSLKLSALVFIVTNCSIIFASAASLYVDGQLLQNCSNGTYSIQNRNCTGQDGNGYRHPQEAANTVQPGDSVFIRGETYGPSNSNPVLWIRKSGQEGAPIRFQNYNNELVILDAQNTTFAVYLDGRAVRGGANYLQIVGFDIRNSVGQAAILARQGDHILIEKNEIHHNAAPATLFVDQGELPAERYDIPENFRHYGHHTIRRNHVYRNHQGIRVLGNYCLVEENYAHHNVDHSYPGNSDGFMGVGDYLIVRKNVAHDNSDDGFDFGNGGGIMLFGSDDREGRFNIIEYNTAYNNGEVDGAQGDGGGMKFHTHDPHVTNGGGPYLIRHNIVFDNRTNGFPTAGGYRPQDQLYMPDIFYGNIAYNNASTDDADGIVIEEGSIIMFNNISWNPNNGVFRDVRYAGVPADPIVSNHNLWGDRWIVGENSGNEYDCMDLNSTDQTSPLFVNPTGSGINTDLASPDFGEAFGFRLEEGAAGIDHGADVRVELTALRAQVEANPPYVTVPTCTFGEDKNVPIQLWLDAIDFALSEIPNPFPYDGNAPDIGAFEFESDITGNRRPRVDAGENQTLVPPENRVNLNGVVSDDGLPNPPGRLVTTWSKLSGPGNVTFENPSDPVTVARLSQEGTYILRLAAYDGALSSFDDIKITFGDSSTGDGDGDGDDGRGDSDGRQDTRFRPCMNPKDLSHRMRLPICYDLHDSVRVLLEIYGPDGRLIRRLKDEDESSRSETVYWDRRNDAGDLVASGIYNVLLRAGDKTFRSKIVVIK